MRRAPRALRDAARALTRAARVHTRLCQVITRPASLRVAEYAFKVRRSGARPPGHCALSVKPRDVCVR
jgi:hypothetical protein